MPRIQRDSQIPFSFIFLGVKYGYSYPQIDGKVNPYKFDGDLLFHLFGDDYKCI